MKNDKVKSINALLKYMRNKKLISINGGNQKKKLRNIGYYHGYKGYRFYCSPNNKLHYTNFNELQAVYTFDMQIKSLLYPQVMFLETALKNYALEVILKEANSNRFAEIYSKVLINYKSYTVGSNNYKKALSKRLELRNKIYSVLSYNYNNKLIVKHFYDKDKPVPIWAIFELISFGEFGNFLLCLSLHARLSISKSIGINTSYDPDGNLTGMIVYALKDLRNAIAHNDAIFDTRFKTGSIANRISTYLVSETNVDSINFTTIVDYIVLVAFLLKHFNCSKTEINKFISDFILTYENLRRSVPASVFSKIIHTDTRTKLQNLKSFIKK